MKKAQVICIQQSVDKLKYLPNRTPHTVREDAADSFAVLSEYRDGAIYVTHYAGFSEWERHPNGDEIVYLLEGETHLILLTNENEVPIKLVAGELIIVPQNTWHRFESPNGVKVLTVTPQPTDHSTIKPGVT